VTFAWLGQLTQVAARGSWSPDALRDLDPLPRQVSIAAGFMLVPLAVWTTWTVMVRGRALWVTHRACRHLQPTTHGSYSIVDSAALDAFTTASGHIIFTTGLLEVLTPAQQQIVLTHERSHHRHRHNWWTLAVDLAAAVNPLLRPTAAGIRHATERWADEDAATVADRHTVAVTIANVALLRSRAAAVAPAAMGATGGQVPRRVQAARGDLRQPESDATLELLGLSRAGKVELFTSAVALGELEKIPREEYKMPHKAIYTLLEKVHAFPEPSLTRLGPIGSMGNPYRFIWHRTQKLLPDLPDVHHVYQVIMHKLDYFVTVDWDTILKHREALASDIGVHAVNPSELLAEVRELPHGEPTVFGEHGRAGGAQPFLEGLDTLRFGFGRHLAAPIS
jgi:hypothetical protein